MAMEPKKPQKDSVQNLDLGPQPNGDFKLVCTIPELYVEAVKDWAISDGITVEQWIDNHLSAFLETWASPARGR